jgi:serine/threonine-protein kinase RsbW/stage II sporulation protein AB (anti-sigma F factor)
MPAVPKAIPELRRAVAEFAAELGVPDPPLADVKLAVTEAVTNVVVHGYRRRAPGPVAVRARRDDHELRLVIADCGDGYAPRTDSPGLGVGVAVISSVADRVEIRKAEPRGTEVHICWSLAA